MRVAQMGMGVVTVAAQRVNFAGNGLGGDGRVGDRDGADGGGDEEQRCAGRSIRAAETRSTQKLWCSTQLPTTRRRRAMPKYPPNGVPMSVFGALGPGPGAVS